jgi:signal transduction histidine kinase
MDIKIFIRRVTLMLSIYGILLFISFAVSFPLVKRIFGTQATVSLPTILCVGVIVGVVLSFGPFIYAYFVRNNYWLRGHVTTGLTHELKSPLSAIQSAIDVMSEEVESATINKSKAAGYIEMIKKNASRLENYIQDLLNLAKIQDENISIEKSRFDLSTMVSEVIDSYKPSADKKKLDFKFSVEPGIEINGDPSKLRQAVSNLISNAVKFSEKGFIKAELTRQNGAIHFSVQDFGPGLKQDEIKKMFDRFYQAKPNTKGSGIGLTIAKAWVEVHGGHIWAESEGEGKGTKVTFTLPIS